MREYTHLEADELQTFAEGRLPEGERPAVESHLTNCASCQAEVQEWRQLFESLSVLPQYEPSAGFADRVMAGVREAHATALVPWYVRSGQRASAFVVRVTPRTTRGWAFASALFALPVIASAMLMSWLMSKAYATPGALLTFGADKSAHALESLGRSTIQWALQTKLVGAIVELGGVFVQQAGLSGVGALIAVVAMAICLSIWVLYNNLFRSPTPESSYVSYSF